MRCLHEKGILEKSLPTDLNDSADSVAIPERAKSAPVRHTTEDSIAEKVIPRNHLRTTKNGHFQRLRKTKYGFLNI